MSHRVATTNLFQMVFERVLCTMGEYKTVELDVLESLWTLTWTNSKQTRFYVGRMLDMKEFCETFRHHVNEGTTINKWDSHENQMQLFKLVEEMEIAIRTELK